MSSANDPNTFIGADNQIADLLAAPMIRDAQDITWYAAGGVKNTWLRITKTGGEVDIRAFKRKAMGAEVTEMQLEDFSHRSLRPDPANLRGLTEELSRSHYAVAQLAMACQDAWERSDVSMYNATMGLLAQHMPSVGDMYERAKTLAPVGAPASADFTSTLGKVLAELWGFEALIDDPKGASTLDPWFRAQQLVRVASVSSAPPRTGLYAFESEREKSFLLVMKEDGEGTVGFNMWLDAGMQPLLMDYTRTGGARYLESPGYTWEWPRPYPGTVTGWSNAMASMANVNAAPFASLKNGTLHALSPQETLDAIEAWAGNPASMAAWDKVDDPQAMMAFGQWALNAWVKADPQSGQLLQSLLPEIDASGNPSQLDAWRQLLAASKTASPPAASSDPLPLANLV